MHYRRKTTVGWILLLSLAGLTLLCFTAFGYFFYWRPDPVSPPATELGKDPLFDSRLNRLSKNWVFLLRNDGRIISTDIYGRNPAMLLDIVKATNNINSELLEHASISPNSTRIAIDYFARRDPLSGEPDGKIIILNLKSRGFFEVPFPTSDFKFDWTTSAYWLTDEVFVVKMNRLLNSNASSEQYRFLLYDVNQISTPKSFDLDPCPLPPILSLHSQSLLIASDCVPLDQRKVWAIDAEGKRPASSAEVAFFSEHEMDRYEPKDTYQNSSAGFPAIKIKPVWGGVEGFGRFFDANWNRQYIFLGNRLVRISDAIINFEPNWQTGIELFIWTEGNHTYIMDMDGHYRLLFDGVYLGKIPSDG